MLKSMTGFGRYGYSDEDISVDFEMKTINSRYLDLSIRMPNQFNFLEDKIRKLIKKTILRGRVEVYIRTAKKNVGQSQIQVDLDAAVNMRDSLQSIIDITGLDTRIDLADILRNEDVLTYKQADMQDEYLENIVIGSLESTLKALDEMRRLEGENLTKVLSSYIDEIEENLEDIASLSQNLTMEYRDKLRESIKKLLDDNLPINEDRLANEIVFYADRADIQEEITRMKSHIKLFRDTITSKQGSGKKLDFISQEMLRETNTIGSKSNKEQITKIVIEQKTIIEKIKEQVQNIE
ncbi:MAG: YicC/YloC family endoribonuclease [Tissierellia bacterium]|nr:YicC/YloC family endoribonuclease [Tissierellia bacterium]